MLMGFLLIPARAIADISGSKLLCGQTAAVTLRTTVVLLPCSHLLAAALRSPNLTLSVSIASRPANYVADNFSSDSSFLLESFIETGRNPTGNSVVQEGGICYEIDTSHTSGCSCCSTVKHVCGRRVRVVCGFVRGCTSRLSKGLRRISCMRSSPYVRVRRGSLHLLRTGIPAMEALSSVPPALPAFSPMTNPSTRDL